MLEWLSVRPGRDKEKISHFDTFSRRALLLVIFAEMLSASTHKYPYKLLPWPGYFPRKWTHSDNLQGKMESTAMCAAQFYIHLFCITHSWRHFVINKSHFSLRVSPGNNIFRAAIGEHHTSIFHLITSKLPGPALLALCSFYAYFSLSAHQINFYFYQLQ